MQAEYIIKNGQLLDRAEGNISVYNKSLFFDFCVYSNIKVVNGRMFCADLEIDKLFESAEAIGMKTNFNSKEVMDWARQLIEKNNLKDALIRLLLVGPEQNTEAQLFLFAVGLTFYPDKFYKEGVKLISFSGERYFPTAKTTNLLMSYLAYREATKQEALDALLVDRQGNIREGTRSSFFVIKDNFLIMPPSGQTLPGLTKKIILEILPDDMRVKEENIPLADIEKYDDYFISATSMKIMPVSQIDGHVLTKGPSERLLTLMKLFKEYEKKYFV
ncbi:MAG: hypothetical protein COU31_02520 [Candidatus Magasanikbacteria bacterium CG10_big_fil_rev_8_21_14_0_10_40_10]|uniref:Amino acid aminotransferase n=1 Tax=Candidatus Magasanikbacteria bacterium CG10_big_fil_rev_8_21_14_0_10_40_10 TaxID=1974648 RepID=A0A2M6W422_9BACT|nr:MAG: hypothetical protein COU31_02520 [Candidatus Magasanikbacteria bacterium CG10_big_fil_rev_8_21_14_0_10_40_10]